MKQMIVAALSLVFVASGSLGFAEEVKSGLEAGKFVGAFYVTKVAGAEDDGVAISKNLCYRCKNGGRPQVMVFTRSADESVAKLIQKLDAEVAKNESKDLRAFVNTLGEEKAAAEKAAKSLAASSKAKNVPFVVPNEVENGPDNYGINPKAEVTVLLVAGGQVKANHAFASAKDVKVDSVIADLSKILN